MLIRNMSFIAALVATLFTGTSAQAAGTVNVYNWSDYIGDDVVAKFEKESGIKVVYDVFDSNEVLEGKLLAGRTGYDVVVPSIEFMGRQIQAGIFQPLQKDKLPNYKELDPALMATIAKVDPGNAYGVPYVWGTTGIGIIKEKVIAALGPDAPLDSWDLVLKPENLAKLSSCGVAFLDSPNEIFAVAMHYLGKDPNSKDVKDYQGEAKALLQAARTVSHLFPLLQVHRRFGRGRNLCGCRLVRRHCAGQGGRRGGEERGGGHLRDSQGGRPAVL